MMKNILITGGAGFIGSNLSLRLAGKGYIVTVLDSLSPQVHGPDPEQTSPLYRSIAGKVRFVKGSVTRREDWLSCLEKQDVIVHLAAETGTGQSMYEIHRYVDTNIGGTSLLTDLLANTSHSVQKVIVASSRAIYGEGKYFSPELGTVYPAPRKTEDMERGDFEVKYPGCSEPLQLRATSEDSKIHPSSVYGITKQTQEQLVMTVCQSLGIAAIAFRYQNVYGPGQSLSNPYTGILSIFSTRIMNGHEINIFEDGLESRDFVYINDVVDATLAGIENDRADGQVLNVGYGTPISVLSVAEKLCRHLNKQVPVTVTGNFRLGDIRHNFADNTKIKQLLDFIPQYSFDQGLSGFAQWVVKQEFSKDEFDHSFREMKQKGMLK